MKVGLARSLQCQAGRLQQKLRGGDAGDVAASREVVLGAQQEFTVKLSVWFVGHVAVHKSGIEVFRNTTLNIPTTVLRFTRGITGVLLYSP